MKEMTSMPNKQKVNPRDLTSQHLTNDMPRTYHKSLGLHANKFIEIWLKGFGLS